MKKVSKTIIQEAISQELSKKVVNEKLTDIPSNIFGGIKNVASGLKGQYNVGKINNQLQRSAERLDKEWQSTVSTTEKAMHSMATSSNADVRASAQTVWKNLTSADGDVKKAIQKLKNTSATGVNKATEPEQQQGNSSGSGNLNLMDDEGDFAEREMVTKHGTKYKEQSVDRWLKGLGLNPEKIGVHERNQANKLFLDLRMKGINPFRMSPEQVGELYSLSQVREQAMKTGQGDPFPNFEHFEKVLGKAAADKLRALSKERLNKGLPAEESPNQNMFASKEAPNQGIPASRFKQNQAPGATPTPAAGAATPPAPADGAKPPLDFSQELKSEPVSPGTPPQATPAPAAPGTPEQPQVRIGPNRANRPAAQARNPNSQQAGSSLNDFKQVVADPEFHLTKQEIEQVYNILSTKGLQPAFLEFKKLASIARSRPRIGNAPLVDKREPVRTTPNPPPTAPPAAVQGVSSTPKPPNSGFEPVAVGGEEEEPDPIPLVSKKPNQMEVPLPPQSSNVVRPKKKKKLVTPSIADTFSNDPRMGGSLPVQDKGTEVQVGSPEVPGFGPTKERVSSKKKSPPKKKAAKKRKA